MISLAVRTAAFCPVIHFLVMQLNSQQLETAAIDFLELNLSNKSYSFQNEEFSLSKALSK